MKAFLITAVIAAFAVATFADWKAADDVGKGRIRIVQSNDSAPIAPTDALVEMRDYPSVGTAKLIIDAHNTELGRERKYGNINSLMVASQMNFHDAQDIIFSRNGKLTKKQAEDARQAISHAYRHMDAAITFASEPIEDDSVEPRNKEGQPGEGGDPNKKPK